MHTHKCACTHIYTHTGGPAPPPTITRLEGTQVRRGFPRVQTPNQRRRDATQHSGPLYPLLSSPIFCITPGVVLEAPGEKGRDHLPPLRAPGSQMSRVGVSALGTGGQGPLLGSSCALETGTQPPLLQTNSPGPALCRRTRCKAAAWLGAAGTGWPRFSQKLLPTARVLSRNPIAERSESPMLLCSSRSGGSSFRRRL